MNVLPPGDRPRFLGFMFQKGPEANLVPLDALTVLYGLNGAGKTGVLESVQSIFSGTGRGPSAARPWGNGGQPLALIQLAHEGSERNMSWWSASRDEVLRRHDFGPLDGERGFIEWVGAALDFNLGDQSVVPDNDRRQGLVDEWVRQRLVLIAPVGTSDPHWVSWPAIIEDSSTPWAKAQAELSEQHTDDPVGGIPSISGRVEGVYLDGRRIVGLCGGGLRPTEWGRLEGVAHHTFLPNIGLRLNPQMKDFGAETRDRLVFQAGFFDYEEVEFNEKAQVLTLAEPLQQLRNQLEALANSNFAGVLRDAPSLRLSVGVQGLYAGVSWGVASDARSTGQFMVGESPRPLDQLSSAERRWAQWAIRDAIARVLPVNADVPEAWVPGWGDDPEVDWTIDYPMPIPSLTIIDEPERALHRSAEAHMASFLRRTADREHRFLVATHSPELLDASESAVIQVSRQVEGPPAMAVLSHADRDAMGELGLTASDLLRRQRGFLLVEGQHDMDVVDIVLGEELRRLRVEVLPLRGATQLSAARSRFLFEYTDAHVIVMLDNLHTQRVIDGWADVRSARLRDGLDAARHELMTAFAPSRFGKGTEIRILTEFLSAALDSDDWHRVTPFGLSDGDVIEYLPVRELVPGKRSWAELRADFEYEITNGQTKARNFKAWLASRGAQISDEMVRQAARSLPEIPRDLQLLIKTLEARTSDRDVVINDAWDMM
ncbi:ATP-dependent nuclease [Aeromicrobium duanguangcaii]|uniref:ATP-dependent nuclease n=1 Tax=Aeromicrobium duanguangcaii TaxID=2968086 RepID=UPI0020181C8D|nr:ATP-binding protein [Aeromicrobium duanguangcaii]MCL3836866.1 ATP-binding protein [Aeromicrobium duanguangcaii]